MANELTIPQKVKGASVTFSVKVGGTAVPQTMEIFSATVTREINRIPSAKLVILDGEPAKGNFAVSAADTFLPGKEIEIFAGHQSSEDSIFKGIIVRHGISARRNGASQLSLECKDPSFRLTLGRKSNYFTKTTDTNVANTFITNAKLKAGNIEDTKSEFPLLVQYDSSDWDFLVSRMDINGKLVIANDGTIDIVSPNFNSNPVLTLEYGGTIHEFDAEMDVRNQYKAVKAIAWDHTTQDLLQVDGKEPKAANENGNIKSTDLADATGLEELVLRHAGLISREELQAWANAGWQKSRLAKIRGRVTFDGYAGIRPGQLIVLKGLGERFNGKVFVSAIRHELAKGGWVTTAQFGIKNEWFSEQFSPPLTSGSLLPGIHGLHTAAVVQIEKDPDGEDRVLVRIPMVNIKTDGIWARVATLDAGKQRGSFFRPEVGDEVVVGFINNDPRQAVILGMLNSSKLPAAIQAEKSNKVKGFFFANKMKLLFNEEDKSMTYESPAGNKIIATEKQGDEGITLQDQNGSKIILNKDGITLESAKKIMFKASSGDIEVEGINIKQKAQAEFKAEGSAGVEVSSSAIAKLKGSLVQIN